MIGRQRGMLLLPVTIAMAVIGALAYSMTREGAMGVSAIDRQYDLESARYLAEAGVRLAKWQNEKQGCSSSRKFTDVSLPGVAGTVTAANIRVKNGDIDVTVVSSTPLGAASTLQRTNLGFYDRTALRQLTIPASDGKDTFIRSGSGNQASADFLEATDNRAHPLVEFSLNDLPDDAMIASAELSMYHYDTKSVQVVRSLAAHAVTRDARYDDATWTFPWTNAGGDYDPVAAASTAIAGNGRYAWRIDALARRWLSKAQPNYGVLFKPLGLNEARFYSLNNAAERPRLAVQYYARCR